MQLSEKIDAIKLDRSNGASQIARNALGVLRFFVQTSQDKNAKEFVENFSKVGQKLFEARPNMAPVQNLVAQVVYDVAGLDETDFVSVRKFALSRIDDLIKQSENAVKQAAKRAAGLISNSDCVVTCSYSSTMCETFQLAKQQGKRFKVFVAQSKSADGKFCYGEVLAQFLESIDVDVEVFADDKISKFVSKSGLALVGADSVLFDGRVVNGAPSGVLAVEANKCGVPFYCVCETAKFSVLSYLGKDVDLKQGFDCVPSGLVSGVVTESGDLGVDQIVDVMKSLARFFENCNVYKI